MIQAHVQKTDYAVIPTGLYHCRLIDVKEAEKKAEWLKPGDDPKQWMWKFEVMSGPEAGITLVGFTDRSAKISWKSGKWISGILGRSITDGETIILDDLIGTECTLLVKDKKRDGSPGNVIDSIAPYPARPERGPSKADDLAAELEGPAPAQTADYIERYLQAVIKLGWDADEEEYGVRQVLGQDATTTDIKALSMPKQMKVATQFEAWAQGSDLPF